MTVIATKLVETNFYTRWHCHACGGHTEKVAILCEGDLTAIGLTGRVRVCEKCLKAGDLDQRLNDTARDLEELAALTRSLVGKIKTPTYAEWVEREYLADAAFPFLTVRETRNESKRRLRDKSWGPTGVEREVLARLVAMPDADLTSLITSHFPHASEDITADLRSTLPDDPNDELPF
jgi:hypothetical protein